MIQCMRVEKNNPHQFIKWEVSGVEKLLLQPVLC